MQELRCNRLGRRKSVEYLHERYSRRHSCLRNLELGHVARTASSAQSSANGVSALTSTNRFRIRFPQQSHLSTAFPQDLERFHFYCSCNLPQNEGHESLAPEARHSEKLGRARSVPEAVTITDEQMVARTSRMLRFRLRFAIARATNDSNDRSHFLFSLPLLVRSTEIGASYSCVPQGLEGFAQKSTTFLSFNRISEAEHLLRSSAVPILCNSCFANDQQLTTNDNRRSTVHRPLST